MTRTLATVLVILLLCPPHGVAAQGLPTWQQLERRNIELNRLREAADLYRAGRGAEALQIQDELGSPVGAVGLMVRFLPRMLDHKEVDRLPPGADQAVTKLKPWTIGQARAFAAMQMEVLLRDYQRRHAPTSEGFNYDRAETADALFGVIAERLHEPSAAARWELAIGLTAFSDRQLGWAGAALSFACGKHPQDPSLQLACGSLSDIRAAQPADLLVQNVIEPAGPKTGSRTTPNPFEVAARELPRETRQAHLDAGRRLLDDFIQAEPSNVEARLRLAHIHIQSRKDTVAAVLLESLLSGSTKLDARDEFLACLFLAGIRQRAGQLAAAASLLDRAATAVPSGQSALVARVAIDQERGNASAVAAALDRLFRAPANPPDPWLDFHRGQFWTIDPLLAALRAEARQ